MHENCEDRQPKGTPQAPVHENVWNAVWPTVRAPVGLHERGLKSVFPLGIQHVVQRVDPFDDVGDKKFAGAEEQMTLARRRRRHARPKVLVSPRKFLHIHTQHVAETGGTACRARSHQRSAFCDPIGGIAARTSCAHAVTHC